MGAKGHDLLCFLLLFIDFGTISLDVDHHVRVRARRSDCVFPNESSNDQVLSINLQENQDHLSLYFSQDRCRKKHILNVSTPHFV